MWLFLAYIESARRIGSELADNFSLVGAIKMTRNITRDEMTAYRPNKALDLTLSLPSILKTEFWFTAEV